MDEAERIVEEIKHELVPRWNAFLEGIRRGCSNSWLSLLAYQDAIREEVRIQGEIMDGILEKYGWSPWIPANEDEKMLYQCMNYYEALSGANQTVAVYVKDGYYLLLIQRFTIENLRAEIVDEEHFRGMLEVWRECLEEDVRRGCADYLDFQ